MKEELNYPLTTSLRIVMTGETGKEKCREIIQGIIEDLQIPHSDWSVKERGKYLRLKTTVTIRDRDTMVILHELVSKVDAVKFAI
jgi:putative lipoic acid-binding regulatory protein